MLKATSPLIIGAWLSLMVTHQALCEPFDESKGFAFYVRAHPINKTILPSRKEQAIDQAILDLSRTSGVNFIADVTEIPATVRVAPFPATPVALANKWEPKFYNVSEDMEEAAQLSELRYDDNTYLLWKRPNVVVTANALVNAGKFSRKPSATDAVKLYEDLEEFQKKSSGWTNDLPDFTDANFRLADVPPNIRQPLLDLIRHQILRPDWKREALLTNDYWKTARVFLVPVRDSRTGKVLPRVYIGGQEEKGRSMPLFRVFGRHLEAFNDNSESINGKANTPTENVVPLGTDGEGITNFGGMKFQELQAELHLNKNVSFEFARQPLPTVLNELSKQSGIPLSLAENNLTLLVTAKGEKMPLYELMGALSRLSGTAWSKNKTGYELQGQTLPLWQKLLLYSGRGDFEGRGIETQHTPDELRPIADLEQAVVDEAGEDAQKPPGVQFSTLSGDLQNQVKELAQGIISESLVRSYNDAYVFSSSEAILHLIHPLGTNPTWRAQLLMADNRNTLAVVDLPSPSKVKDEHANAVEADAEHP